MKKVNLLQLIVLIIALSFVFSANTNKKTVYLSGDIMTPWEGGPAYYAKWQNGPSSDPNFFPIAVWWQDVARAADYKRIGVNTYIYLGKTPSIPQLLSLSAESMSAVCVPSLEVSNATENGIVKMWMNPRDEQDNALKGTTVPVTPAEVIANYEIMKKQDPSRPVFLPLGQGVAIDSWYGRGDRTNHPEDYIEYAKGSDVLSFDVYPMNVRLAPAGEKKFRVDFTNELYQKIWYVAKGVDNLRKASDYKKPVWVWLECTNYSGDSACQLTPNHTKAEAWMAIIHGARGIGYFCHVFKPKFNQAALLADTAMSKMVASINAQVMAHAPVLNSQSVANAATISSSNQAVPVDIMAKRHEDSTYIYAVAMRPGVTKATFKLRDFVGKSIVEVVGEHRNVVSVNGVFKDSFANYGVHIYKVKTQLNKIGK
jgi:hypothetical protein